MKTTLLKTAVGSALVASAAFGQDTFFFRVESAMETRITGMNRDGLLTWSNAVTPSSFYLSGTLSLNPTDTWHRVIYGETTNRNPTVQAPLANPLVLLGAFPRGTNLWVGRPFDSWRKQIKSSGNGVRFASVSTDERHILYSEANVIDTEDDFAVRHYDVLADTTTTLVTHAGRRVAFDRQDQRYFFYIDSPQTTIVRRALDGSTNTPWITDGGRSIGWFDQSRDGNRIMIISHDVGPPYFTRFVTFTNQGVFERLLLAAFFDCWNCAFSPDGDQAVVSYREVNCDGQAHVSIFDLTNPGADRELSEIAAGWPSSFGGLFIAWSPYDQLLTLETNLFFSPGDGHVTGTWSTPPGYGLVGVDSDWRWYVTDQSLSHILRLQRNP